MFQPGIWMRRWSYRFLLVFFFSSRRRHTRLQGDWSSDVCSSDLASLAGLDLQICYAMKANSNLAVLRLFANLGAAFDLVSGGELKRVAAAGGSAGSEEGRVGEEGRSRWAPDH